MGLHILSIRLGHGWVWFVAVALQRALDHAKAATGFARALEGFISLQADDDIFFLGQDVSRTMADNGGWRLGVAI